MVEERMRDGFSDGVSANAPVLADVSNQFGKRKFGSISTSYGTGNANQERSVEFVTGKTPFPRNEFTGVDNPGNGKVVFQFGVKDNSPVLKAKQFVGSWKVNTGFGPLQQISEVGIERLPGETSDTSIFRKCNMLFRHEDVVKESVSVGGIGSEDIKNKQPVSFSVGVGQKSDEEKDSDTTETLDARNEVTNICASSIEGLKAAGGLASNRCSSIAASVPSSGYKEPKSEKCEDFHFDSSSNASTGPDLLRTCSCSFCLKAAHIWSDLQYQDTKSRIAALKRSRKDVRSVINKSSSYGGFGKTVLGTSNKPTKLEHDLMGQWRSLFLHTEDVLIRENTQLDSSLSDLKELRDNCKSNLETISMKS